MRVYKSIYKLTTINTTRLSVVSVTVAAALAGWPVTVSVVEVGVVMQPGADAGRYRCACLHCTQGLARRGDGYQCGLDLGLSSYTYVLTYFLITGSSVNARRLLHW